VTADPEILHQYVKKIEVTEYKIIEEQASKWILLFKTSTSLDPAPKQKNHSLSALTRPTGHSKHVSV